MVSHRSPRSPRSPSTSRAPRSPAVRASRPPRSPLRAPLQNLVDEFLDEVEQTLAPATGRAYRGPLSLYLTHLRDTLERAPQLGDCTIETVRAWAAQLREQPKQLGGGLAQGDEPIALASLRTYLRTLCVFANWLPKPPHRYVDESPLRYFKLPRGEETAKVPVETNALRKLLRRAEQETDSVCGARGRALLLTLVDGGLRAKELISLTIGDVSLKEGILVIRRSKGKKPRMIALGEETVRALRRYATLRDGVEGANTGASAPFFQTIHGAAFTYYGLRSWLRRLERGTGVSHVYLHLLRHTSAIETFDAGADVRTVQFKHSYADINTIQGYLNVVAEMVSQFQRAFTSVSLSETNNTKGVRMEVRQTTRVASATC